MSAATKNVLTLDRIIVTMLTAPTTPQARALVEQQKLIRKAYSWKESEPFSWDDPSTWMEASREEWELAWAREWALTLERQWIDKAWIRNVRVRVPSLTCTQIEMDRRKDRPRRCAVARLQSDDLMRNSLPTTRFKDKWERHAALLRMKNQKLADGLPNSTDDSPFYYATGFKNVTFFDNNKDREPCPPDVELKIVKVLRNDATMFVQDARQNVSNAAWEILKPQRIFSWQAYPVPDPTEIHKPKRREKKCDGQWIHPWCDPYNDDAACSSPFIGPVAKALYDLPKSGDLGYSGDPFDWNDWKIVDIEYGVQEAKKIKYAGELMFNREKISGEVRTSLPYYNASACKSCKKRFGRKQFREKGEYLPVDVPYPCPDCGVNNDFDDPGMTYNDVEVSNKNARRWFEIIRQRLGLTLFRYSGVRLTAVTTFPRPKLEWGAWEYSMEAHKLGNVFSLGLGSKKGGPPSAFLVYVSEDWHLDVPWKWKIKAKEHWGSVPRGEDADVMFPVKEKVDKLLHEPKPERLPAWDDPDVINVT